jgi:hypothetical protein
LAKGALRFGADGFAGEAVKGNETQTPILRVDANQLISKARTSAEESIEPKNC